MDDENGMGAWLKDWRFQLSVIFAFALIVRLLPGWLYAVWGNDFGTYYGLTEEMLHNPKIFPDYDGWGSGYNYFPILFYISAGASWITGMDPLWLMPRLIPLIGSLTVVVMFFIGKELFDNERIGLLAALILAANPMHVYQLSHAAPLTVGHLFFCLSLYLFISNEGKAHKLVLLGVFSALMIMSHHLTALFYIMSIIGIVFYKNMWSTEWRTGFRREFSIIVCTSAGAFAYWALIAKPVFDTFIPDAAGMPGWSVFALFYVAVGALVCVIVARRRFMPGLDKIRQNVGGARKVCTFLCIKCVTCGLKKKWVFLLAVACSIVFTVIFSLVNLPGGGFRFQIVSVVLLLPLFVFLGIAFTAIRTLKGTDGGSGVLGWFGFLCASLIITTALWIEGVPPFRHLEYIAYPLSLMCAVGVWELARNIKDSKIEFPFGMKGLGAVVIVLALVGGAGAYAVQNTTSQHTEIIGNETVELMKWMQQNIPESVNISSDHRLCTLLWAYGFDNVSYDDTYEMWFAENWSEEECTDDLSGNSQNTLRIEYVLIDNIMVERGVQSRIVETPRTMDGRAYEKFKEQPFELVHTVRGKQYWGEIYSVNWTYMARSTLE